MRNLLVALLATAVLLAGCTSPTVEPADATAAVPSLHCVEPCLYDAGMAYEPFAAVHPSDPDHLVVVGGSPGTGAVDQYWMAAFVSRDGGASWQRTDLPGRSLGDGADVEGYGAAADPMVAMLADGTVVVAALGTQEFSGACLRPVDACQGTPSPTGAHVDVLAWTSRDGGSTFEAPVVVAAATGTRAGDPQGLTAQGYWNDKPYLAADPATGSLYLGYNERSSVESPALRLHVLRSDDEGGTWTPRLVVEDAYGAGLAALDDHVLLTYNGGGFTSRASHDGGASWGEPVRQGDIPQNFRFWQPTEPALWHGADGVEAAIALPAGDLQERVELAWSPDAGDSWPSRTVAFESDGAHKRNVGWSVAPDGTGLLSFVDGHEAYHLVVMPTVGVAAGEPLQVSEAAFNDNDERDYHATAWAGGRGVVAWVDKPTSLFAVLEPEAPQ